MIVQPGEKCAQVVSAGEIEFIVVAAFRRQTLAGEMLVLQLAIVVVVLMAVAAVSLAQSEATFNRVEGRRVGALAEQLAAQPLVRTRLVGPSCGGGAGPAGVLGPGAVAGDVRHGGRR